MSTRGHSISVATASMTVTSVNDAPTAVVDSATAIEAGGTSNGTTGTNPTGNVMTNGTDVDSGDTKTVTGILAGVQASAAGNIGSSVTGTFGSINTAANGAYTYTVDQNNATVQALRTTANTSNGGGATASTTVYENTTAVTTVVGDDVDSGTTLSYSIVGGADSAKFTINSSTGAITFVSAPDFELPTDVGGDNVYDVTVQVSDGSLVSTQAVAVTVANSLTNDVIYATQDTYLNSNSTTLNYGQSTSLVVDRSGGGFGNQRALVDFGTSAIPVGASITSASLQMQATQNGGAMNLNVYRITQAWSEGSGNGTVG